MNCCCDPRLGCEGAMWWWRGNAGDTSLTWVGGLWVGTEEKLAEAKWPVVGSTLETQRERALARGAGDIRVQAEPCAWTRGCLSLETRAEATQSPNAERMRKGVIKVYDTGNLPGQRRVQVNQCFLSISAFILCLSCFQSSKEQRGTWQSVFPGGS